MWILNIILLQIKVLIIHGKNDGAIELKYSLAGKNLMEKLGMETQYVIKERGHGQAPDFYEIVESWLNNILNK